jgi:hypothetical protein
MHPNPQMEQMVQDGDALDVMQMGRELEPGLYELDCFLEDVDYCDLDKAVWIWSIGKEVATGRIFASSNVRFYKAPDYECLYLR